MNLDKEMNDLYAFGKSIRKMSDEEKVIAMSDYLGKNELSVEIADRLLKRYSERNGLEYTHYFSSQLSGLFVGYIFGAFFGVKHNITWLLLGVIVLILVVIDVRKRMHSKNLSQIRIVLNHIELNSLSKS
jgi:hypothetical protein